MPDNEVLEEKVKDLKERVEIYHDRLKVTEDNYIMLSNTINSTNDMTGSIMTTVNRIEKYLNGPEGEPMKGIFGRLSICEGKVEKLVVNGNNKLSFRQKIKIGVCTTVLSGVFMFFIAIALTKLYKP